MWSVLFVFLFDRFICQKKFRKIIACIPFAQAELFSSSECDGFDQVLFRFSTKLRHSDSVCGSEVNTEIHVLFTCEKIKMYLKNLPDVNWKSSITESHPTAQRDRLQHQRGFCLKYNCSLSQMIHRFNLRHCFRRSFLACMCPPHLKPLDTFGKSIVQGPHFVYHNLYIK